MVSDFKSLFKFYLNNLLLSAHSLRQTQIDSARCHIESVEICAKASTLSMLYYYLMKFKQAPIK